MTTKIKITDLQKWTEAYTRSTYPDGEPKIEQYVQEDLKTSLHMGYKGQIATRIDHVSEVNSEGVSSFTMGRNHDEEERGISLQLVGQRAVVGKMKVLFKEIEYLVLGLEFHGRGGDSLLIRQDVLTEGDALFIERIVMGPAELFEIDI